MGRPAGLSEAALAAIEAASGRRVVGGERLHGGCIAEACRLDLDDGSACVAKLPRADGDACDLRIEGGMLRYLGTHSALPVPAVIAAEPDLLLMDFVAAGDPIDEAAERHAAELLAALHGITAPAFGFEHDTPIGPLPQSNPWTESWVAFFAEQRLLPMGRIALERGRLDGTRFQALEGLCGRLERYLPSGSRPALLHGDIWDGNILVRGSRIAAFIDPAIYFGESEIELAFTTLFGTFGPAFFACYGEIRPIEAGFFDCRREIYNLYPLLVHTALFGGSYAASVAAILRKY